MDIINEIKKMRKEISKIDHQSRELFYNEIVKKRSCKFQIIENERVFCGHAKSPKKIEFSARYVPIRKSYCQISNCPLIYR